MALSNGELGWFGCGVACDDGPAPPLGREQAHEIHVCRRWRSSGGAIEFDASARGSLDVPWRLYPPVEGICEVRYLLDPSGDLNKKVVTLVRGHKDKGL